MALSGDMSADDLGLAAATDLSDYTTLALFNRTLGNLESIISGI